MSAVTFTGSNSAIVTRTNIPIGGMTCASCASRVEKSLRKVAGVVDVSVNLATETANVITSGDVQRSTLETAVVDAGYEVPSAKVADPRVSSGKNAARGPSLLAFLNFSDGVKVVIAAMLSLPLVVPMLLTPFGVHWMPPPVWQLALAAPVQFWLGARFYRAGWHAVKAGTGNMDLLVAIGTTAAFGLSLYLMFRAPATARIDGMSHTMPHLYFESAAVVITLVMFGKWLEGRAKRETTAAIRALQALTPPTANLIVGGTEHAVALADIQVGDLLRIRPGERFAADGVIAVGQTHANESMITGESLPVAKTVGDRVTGGALNDEGLVDVSVTAVGAESTLQRIVRMVEDAPGAEGTDSAACG